MDASVSDDFCWCEVNVIHDVPTIFTVVVVGFVALFSFIRTVMSFIFDSWLEERLVRTAWVATHQSLKSPYQSQCHPWLKKEIVLPSTAYITSAFVGFPRNPQKWVSNMEKMIRASDSGLLSEMQITKLLDPKKDVTDAVREELFRGGSTRFKVDQSAGERQYIFLVVGEWRGGCGFGDQEKEVQTVSVSGNKEKISFIRSNTVAECGFSHEEEPQIEMGFSVGPQIEIESSDGSELNLNFANFERVDMKNFKF